LATERNGYDQDLKIASPVTVVVIDDHPLFRKAVAEVLNAAGDLLVVGQASNGEDGAELVCQVMPRVVLMDISMPGMNGIDAALLIKKEHPTVAILALTVHCNAEGWRSRILDKGSRR